MSIAEDIIKNETKEERQERLAKAAVKYLDNGVELIPEYTDDERRVFYRDMLKASIKSLQFFRQRRRSAIAVDDKESIAKWTKLATIEYGYKEEAEQQLAGLNAPKEA